LHSGHIINPSKNSFLISSPILFSSAFAFEARYGSFRTPTGAFKARHYYFTTPATGWASVVRVLQRAPLGFDSFASDHETRRPFASVALEVWAIPRFLDNYHFHPFTSRIRNLCPSSTICISLKDICHRAIVFRLERAVRCRVCNDERHPIVFEAREVRVLYRPFSGLAPYLSVSSVPAVEPSAVPASVVPSAITAITTIRAPGIRAAVRGLVAN